MIKMKIVDPEKLYNFIFYSIFILIHLESRIVISNSVEHNMSRKNICDRHKWVWGRVVRGMCHY